MWLLHSKHGVTTADMTVGNERLNMQNLCSKFDVSRAHLHFCARFVFVRCTHARFCCAPLRQVTKVRLVVAVSSQLLRPTL